MEINAQITVVLLVWKRQDTGAAVEGLLSPCWDASAARGAQQCQRGCSGTSHPNARAAPKTLFQGPVRRGVAAIKDGHNSSAILFAQR